MTLDLYPVVSPETKTYPILNYGVKSLLSDSTMNNGLLWKLQQAVFDAKMETVRRLYGEGYAPVGDMSVEVEIRVVQKVVSAEATNGKAINMPPNAHYLTTIACKGPTLQ